MNPMTSGTSQGGGGGGGGFFSGFIGRAARSFVENALNSTANANTTSGSVQPSRSFFNLESPDSPDSGSYQVLEYSGRNSNNEVGFLYDASF